MEKYYRAGMPQVTIWRMRIACWIPIATDTNSEYVIITAFPLQQCLHERASMLRYAYIACLVLFVQSIKLALGHTQPQREGGPSPPPSAEVENDWSYAASPPYASWRVQSFLIVRVLMMAFYV